MAHTTDPSSGADQQGRGAHAKRDRGDKGEHTRTGGWGGKGLHRRKFLGGLAGVGLASVGAAGATFALLTDGNAFKAAAADTALNIPDLLEGTTADGTTTFALTAQTGTHEVLSGVTSQTAGYNGSYLGPTMKWTKGSTVLLNITNDLGDETSVHFHGAHIPPDMDGGPQNSFADGETWSPTFEIKDEAKTLWYHPHALGTTAEQVVRGLAGLIIVEDDSDASAALPSEYGVDDIPLVLQCLSADTSGDVNYNLAGYLSAGNVYPVLCNGTNVDATTLGFTATKKRTRFRVLNASPSDILTVQRGDGGTLTQIATDQGYLAEAAEVTSIRLVAGGRAEFVLDLDAAVTLQTVVTTGWVRGGSGTYDFLTVTPDASDTPAALPSTLNTITRYDTSAFAARTITLGQSGLLMNINGAVGTTMDAMATIMTTLDAEEVWTISNLTQLEHSFHLHDVPFQLIEINGEAPTGTDLGWFDTYEVVGGGSIKIAMKFTDFADDTYMYMLHCHLLQHEDEGMMAALMVMDS